MKVVIRNYSTEHALVNKSIAIPIRVSVAIFYEISTRYKPCHCIQYQLQIIQRPAAVRST
jgi:hypothetical protein